MNIAILGSGLMGGTLGRIWAACGHDVTFAYSRDRAKLDRLATEAGGRAASVAEAVETADAVLLSVNWAQVDDVLDQAGDLAGQVVLNCCVPLNPANTDLVLGTTTSGAEELAAMRPDARWVACFNTTPSESLFPVFEATGRSGDSGRTGAAGRTDDTGCPGAAGGGRPHLLVYGDDAGALDVAHGLIGDAGFDPLPAGGLRTARFVEPFAMVTAELAYGQPGGPALIYRFDKRHD